MLSASVSWDVKNAFSRPRKALSCIFAQVKVDVIRMRAKGEKLSKDQLRVASPTRGMLSIRDRLEGRDKSVLIALLAGNARFELLLPALDFVKIGPLRGDSFVLKGLEEVGERKRFDSYPQSWWCKLVFPEQAGVELFGYDDDEPELSGAGVMLDAPQWRR